MDVARRYTRDNRGRFAPAGTGATARGGRLRTASGGKRQTRTMQGPTGLKGTISKPRGLKPGAVKPTGPKVREGQARRGLERASKQSMEARRLQATGSALRSEKARRKMDRTNRTAADAQAFYSTGKGKVGPREAARRQARAMGYRATSSIRPGELMNAVARPLNTMAKPQRGQNPYNRFSGHTADNVAIAVKDLQKRGYKVYQFNDKNNSRIAEASFGIRQIGINTASDYWGNPRLRAIDYRRSGHLSTSSPMGVIHHEIKHTKDRASLERYKRLGQKGINDWKQVVPGAGGPASKLRESWRRRDIAGRVSAYARTSPAEFIAETYAGIKTGRRYDYQVMRAYREVQGLSPNPAARRRSRVRRKP